MKIRESRQGDWKAIGSKFVMWNVYVVDSEGSFLSNSQPLNVIEAEELHKLLAAGGLTTFLASAGGIFREREARQCGVREFFGRCIAAIDAGLVSGPQSIGSLTRLLEEATAETWATDEDARGKYWDGHHGDLASDELREFMAGDEPNVEIPEPWAAKIDAELMRLNEATAEQSNG